jgi:hypothetical protein
MPGWLLGEIGLWIVAATAAAGAALATWREAHRLTRILAGLALAAFAAGALVWMFRDTYAYYYAQKDAYLRVSYWGSYQEHQMWQEILAAFRHR